MGPTDSLNDVFFMGLNVFYDIISTKIGGYRITGERCCKEPKNFKHVLVVINDIK